MGGKVVYCDDISFRPCPIVPGWWYPVEGGLWPDRLLCRSSSIKCKVSKYPTRRKLLVGELTRRFKETTSSCSSLNEIPTPKVRLETRRFLGRVRRAGRGSSESSLSSADRLLPVLNGEEEREACKLGFMGMLGAAFLSNGTSVFSSKSAANARSISPRHLWSMSTIVSRSYRPPNPSWMDLISQGGSRSTARPASLVV